MSTMSVRLPASLHKQARELAEREGVSINQLVATALAEKVSALLTLDYLEERASRGSVETFRTVLSKVPAAPPVEGDEL
jgi:hypothetical protein